MILLTGEQKEKQHIPLGIRRRQKKHEGRKAKQKIRDLLLSIQRYRRYKSVETHT